jgi:TonB family protein
VTAAGSLSAAAQSVESRQGAADDGATTGTARNIPEAKPKIDNPRRRTVIGGLSRDVRLTMLAEGWRQWIERKASLATLKAAAAGVASHDDPLVKIAVRPDGSVESVVFERSSGVAAIDDAIRRVVISLAPYPGFPGDLAMDYDVIEFRRVWTFDLAVKLFFGGR